MDHMLTPLPQTITGRIAVPGSKSISNRALVLAALGQGTVELTGMLDSDDTKVMITGLKQVGVKIETIKSPSSEGDLGGAIKKSNKIIVHGSSGKFCATNKEIYLQNAGTATRFFTTLATLIPEETTITGNERMQERPIKDLTDALTQIGTNIVFKKNTGYPPMIIQSDQLAGGRIEISGKISSQYISSLLLSAPYAAKPVEIVITDELVSKKYVDITTQMMRDFGISVEESWDNGRLIFSVPQGIYTNPPTYQIEADASSASYPLAMAAITGGEVTVTNLGKNSLQGDAGFCSVLQKMGCEVTQTATTTTVKGSAKLTGITIDMEPYTDCFLTLATVAATAEGKTKIHNIANQRVKECDRIAAMTTELKKCGVEVTEFADGLTITGAKKFVPAEIDCYDDHRIAMSFAVLGCKVPHITITDPTCSAKTYPTFWDDMTDVFGVKYKEK
jgi:pentafunctional AROM polypeptide